MRWSGNTPTHAKTQQWAPQCKIKCKNRAHQRKPSSGKWRSSVSMLSQDLHMSISKMRTNRRVITNIAAVFCTRRPLSKGLEELQLHEQKIATAAWKPFYRIWTGAVSGVKAYYPNLTASKPRFISKTFRFFHLVCFLLLFKYCTLACFETCFSTWYCLFPFALVRCLLKRCLCDFDDHFCL